MYLPTSIWEQKNTIIYIIKGPSYVAKNLKAFKKKRVSFYGETFLETKSIAVTNA